MFLLAYVQTDRRNNSQQWCPNNVESCWVRLRVAKV